MHIDITSTFFSLGIWFDFQIDEGSTNERNFELYRNFFYLEGMTWSPPKKEITKLPNPIQGTIDGLNDRKDTENRPLARQLIICNLNYKLRTERDEIQKEEGDKIIVRNEHITPNNMQMHETTTSYLRQGLVEKLMA